MMRFMLKLLLASSAVRGIAGQVSITCEMLMTDDTYEDVEYFEDNEDEWNCVDDADILYELAGEWERIFIEHYPFESGETFSFQGVTIEGAEDGEPTIRVYGDTQIEFVHARRRLQSNFIRRSSGSQETLVVRVTDAAGNKPSLEAADVSKRVFGEFTPGSASVASHLKACSGNQLELFPSDRSGNGDVKIVDGVLDITIDVRVTDYNGFERKNLEREVDARLIELGYLGSEVTKYGFFMYVMPHNTNLKNNVLAYAYVKGRKSVYKNVPTFQTNIHEFGHNMGLQHSGFEDGDQTYGDTTCQMGYTRADNDYDYPQKCFNAAKSFHLGWYNNNMNPGHEVINIESEWRGKLVGHHDYFGALYDPSDNRVIANIGSLFINFNRAEAFTEDVSVANTVVVTEVLYRDDGTTPARSLRRTNGVLPSGSTGTYETKSGEKITVVVCDISIDETNNDELDYAEVIIFRNNDAGSLVQHCDSESPTASPTAGPSADPSASPTPAVTTAPTITTLLEDCTSHIELLHTEGETMFDPNAPLLKITSHDTTSLNFAVVNTFRGDLSSTFTMYTTGNYGEYECLQEANVLSQSTTREYTAMCINGNPFTIVRIWALDGTGTVLGLGDNAVVPKCCHADSMSMPTVEYTFKVPCECSVVGSVAE
jgi:hypothetical protein